MVVETILIIVLAILFLVFGLKAFMSFLEILVSGLLKLMAIGIVIALVCSIGYALII